MSASPVELSKKKMNEMLTKENLIQLVLYKIFATVRPDQDYGDPTRDEGNFEMAKEEVLEDLGDRARLFLNKITYQDIVNAPKVKIPPRTYPGPTEITFANESKMKVTKQSLRRMVKEELERVLLKNK